SNSMCASARSRACATSFDGVDPGRCQSFCGCDSGFSSMTKATNLPRLEPSDATADILSRLLYRDGLMLIIDKPAGVPVHRGPRNSRDKSGVSLEDSFDALRFGLPRPPVLAHRLDRDTSGCLVLGRHRKATASLGLLFKHGKIGKTYWS